MGALGSLRHKAEGVVCWRKDLKAVLGRQMKARLWKA